MKRSFISASIGAIAILSLAAVSAQAASVSSTTSAVVGGDASVFNDMRVRWGATGAEVFPYVDPSNPFNNVQINYSGTPVWVLGQTYSFEMDWNSATGTVTGSTSAGAATGSKTLASDVGVGPSYLYLGLVSSDTQTISISNLEVNGVAVSGSNPSVAGNASSYYEIGNVGGYGFTKLTGDFVFNGTSNFASERPKFDIYMASPAAPVPLPASAWGGLVLMGGLGAVSGMKRLRRVES